MLWAGCAATNAASLGVSYRALRRDEGETVFRPGHVEISRLPTDVRLGYRLTLDYHVEGAEPRPEWAYFHLCVEAGQMHIDERFRMHRDVAYNFLQRIRRCLRDHGVQVRQDILFGFHALYDPLYADLREQLHLQPGEAVDLDRFLREG